MLATAAARSVVVAGRRQGRVGLALPDALLKSAAGSPG
jgi:hypothetical protein